MKYQDIKDFVDCHELSVNSSISSTLITVEGLEEQADGVKNDHVILTAIVRKDGKDHVERIVVDKNKLIK